MDGQTAFSGLDRPAFMQCGKKVYNGII